MKKSLILGVAGLVCTITSSCPGQGFIALDNYDSTAHPLITLNGTGINTPGWTAGIYYAQGNVLGSVASDSSGLADPSTLGGGLALGTGLGSTAAIYTSTFNTPGQFFSANTFQASAAAGATITVEIIAYNGASYASSSLRGHSSAFTMTTAAGTSPNPNYVGDAMSSFAIPVPEPTVFALSGAGAVALMLMRRKSVHKRVSVTFH